MDLKRSISTFRVNRKLRNAPIQKLALEDLAGNACDGAGALALVQQGGLVIVPNLLGQLGAWAHLEHILGYTRDDFASLHQSLRGNSLTRFISNKRATIDTLTLQTQIIASVGQSLGFETLWCELEPNLRIHPPYRMIASDESVIESAISTGQATPHSVHKDSWYHHPRNTVNVWVAATPVDEKSGLSFLEGSNDYYPNQRGGRLLDFSDAIASDHVSLHLNAGDAAVFLAESVHGSIINQSDMTRVTLSMRWAPEKPDAQASRRYWYLPLAIRSGRASLSPADGQANPTFDPSTMTRGEYCRSNTFHTGHWDTVDKSIEVVTKDGETLRFPRRCPHKGVDLCHGFFDEATNEIVCPSHRLRVKPDLT